MKKYLIAVTTAIGLLTLTACNTMEGVGKDVERVGEKVQDAAQKK